jgi:hypothetical protein
VVRGPGKDDCAIWAAAVGADGYGRFWVRRGGTRMMVRANRYALAAALEGKPLEQWVRALHGCNNLACVRVSLERPLRKGRDICRVGLKKPQNMVKRPVLEHQHHDVLHRSELVSGGHHGLYCASPAIVCARARSTERTGSRFLAKVDDQIGVVGVRAGSKLLPMSETG